MPDFLGMMKQAAQLQSKMQAMQEELGNVEVEGTSGGGLVSVRMTAKMEVKGVKIDPSLMKADEREILEDLLVTAHNDARRKAELVHTLAQYLEHGGNYDATAAELSVHKSTLKYRLQRIRELTGVELNDPDVHFNLQLATRAWGTLQALRDER